MLNLTRMWAGISACAWLAASPAASRAQSDIRLQPIPTPAKSESAGPLTTTPVHRARFRLPADARQGPQAWYALRLRAGVSVERARRATKLYIAASTNGRTSLQFELVIPPRSSKAAVRWSVYGLLDGQVRKVARSDSFTISGRNFLQYRGVRPGRNFLTVETTHRGEASASIEVAPNTAILSGLPAPPKIEVVADEARVRVDEGTLTVPVLVSNTGGTPDKLLQAEIATDSAKTGQFGRTGETLGTLRPGDSKLIEFRSPVNTAGRIDLRVRVDGRTSSAGAKLSYELAEPDGAGWGAELRVVGAALLLGGAAALIAIRLRRSAPH